MVNKKSFGSATPSAYAPVRKLHLPGGPMISLDEVLATPAAPVAQQPKPGPVKLLAGAGGSVAPYVTPSAIVSSSTNDNGLAQRTRVHAIPSTKGLLTPPLIVQGRRFLQVLHALRHVTMTREAAAVNVAVMYMGVKLTFDGACTLTIEATNQSYTAVAFVPVKLREPVPPWSMIVAPEQMIRALLTLSADSDLEIAPSDRLHVAKFSFGPVGVPADFRNRPDAPVDIDFQAIIKKTDLAKVVTSVAPFIPVDAQRVCLRSIWFDPRKKLAAACDTKQLRYFQIDIRSKARLIHPRPFYIPYFVVMAAAKLEPGEFVLVTLTKQHEVYIAGEADQDYSVYANAEGSQDMLEYDNGQPEPVNEFVLDKTALKEAARATLALYTEDDKKSARMALHFGDRELAVQAEVDSKLGSGDVQRAISYKNWSVPSPMLTKQIVVRPHQLIDAIFNIDGDAVHLGFRKNHSKDDPILVYGPDHKILTVLAPIVQAKVRFGLEEV